MKYINFKMILFIPVVFGLCGLSYPQRTEEIQVLQFQTFLSRNAVHPGETFRVALLLKINSGWHINGHELADEFLIPSSLTFDENQSIRIIDYYYPKAKSGKYEYSEYELLVYEGEVVFAATVKADAGLQAGQQKLTGKFMYQACDHRSCLPPKAINLEIPVDVFDISQETKEINQEIFSKIESEKSNK
jgi:DsbC/DsbD-like thiol-disulfide interchange protein